jgi:hypothetical protein
MNVAFLFRSDHPSLGSCYSLRVMEHILGTGVLQQANRCMRLSEGDILTYSAAAESKTPTLPALIKLCRSVYQPSKFDKLLGNRLDATHGKATVFCWIFQNISIDIAVALDAKLIPDPAYLGAMDVDFSNPLHLRFFRNSLPEVYRFQGRRCSIFYSMGENEDPNIVIGEIFERQGFVIQYEDAGARRTILDNYDTLEHFRRVEDLRRIFAALVLVSDDQMSNLVLMLEELHPKLFDALASAARTLERAETEEDLAQVALSARRLIEGVAGYLFPPRDGEWNGRKIGPKQYRNRLWAYIEQTIAVAGLTDSTLLPNLGREADRLVELFNSGLHARPTREKIQAAFRDLVLWLSQVIELSPECARRGYLAYEDQFLEFFRDVTGKNPADDSGA